MPQQPTGALPQNIMQQSPGDISGQRDRITQALMDVQTPPPVTPMAQQQGMPAASGAPPMAGAMPGKRGRSIRYSTRPLSPSSTQSAVPRMLLPAATTTSGISQRSTLPSPLSSSV